MDPEFDTLKFWFIYMLGSIIQPQPQAVKSEPPALPPSLCFCFLGYSRFSREAIVLFGLFCLDYFVWIVLSNTREENFQTPN